jgi:hypothetical protein
MTLPTIECPLPRQRRTQGSCRLRARQFNAPAPPPAGRVPRVARLLALAHKCDGLLRQGTIAHYAALARLGHISRARVSQIMALINLAPDIQEAILFLPLTVRGRDRLHLPQLQPIARVLDWHQQRLLWRQLCAANGVTSSRCPTPK